MAGENLATTETDNSKTCIEIQRLSVQARFQPSFFSPLGEAESKKVEAEHVSAMAEPPRVSVWALDMLSYEPCRKPDACCFTMLMLYRWKPVDQTRMRRPVKENRSVSCDLKNHHLTRLKVI